MLGALADRDRLPIARRISKGFGGRRQQNLAGASRSNEQRCCRIWRSHEWSCDLRCAGPVWSCFFSCCSTCGTAHTRLVRTSRERLGVSLWPQTVGSTEPLDCDEAAYAYIGHRILLGDVMYRDLTENKPPLGYWLYTLAVAIGGYHELAIRVMPIPFVLATIVLVWWIALRLGGPGIGMPGGGALRDPEHRPVPVRQRRQPRAFHQLFCGGFTGALDSRARTAADELVPRWRRGCASGPQHSSSRSPSSRGLSSWRHFWHGRGPRTISGDDGRRGSCATRCVWPGLVVDLVHRGGDPRLAQGALGAARDDVFQYGRALATDTLPEANAPSAWIRWLTGNADPSKGRLPWPFGGTTVPRLVGNG